jgi:hypothetical protein
VDPRTGGKGDFGDELKNFLGELDCRWKSEILVVRSVIDEAKASVNGAKIQIGNSTATTAEHQYRICVSDGAHDVLVTYGNNTYGCTVTIPLTHIYDETHQLDLLLGENNMCYERAPKQVTLGIRG